MILPNDQIATAFRKSGKTQDTFCSEQGISIHKLRYYLYKKVARRTAIAVKSQIPNISRVPPTLPVEFISFNSQAGNNSDHSMLRQPVTIIAGHFSIAEVTELVAKIGAAVC